MDVLFETRSKNNMKAVEEHLRFFYLFRPIKIFTYILCAYLVFLSIFMLVENQNNGLADICLYVMFILFSLFVGTMGIFQYFRQKKILLRKNAEPKAEEGVSTVTEEGVRSTNADGKVYVTPFSEISRAYIGKTAIFVYSKIQKVDPAENNGKKTLVIIHIFPKDDFTVGDAAGLADWLESKRIKVKNL